MPTKSCLPLYMQGHWDRQFSHRWLVSARGRQTLQSGMGGVALTGRARLYLFIIKLYRDHQQHDLYNDDLSKG